MFENEFEIQIYKVQFITKYLDDQKYGYSWRASTKIKEGTIHIKSEAVENTPAKANKNWEQFANKYNIKKWKLI